MSENKSQTPAQNTPENSEKKKVSLFALIVVLVVAVIVMVALFVRSNNLSSQLDEVNGQLAASNTELQQTIADKETAQAELTTAQNDLREAQLVLEESTAKVAELEAQLVVLNDENEANKAQVETLTAELDTAKANQAAAQGYLDNVSAQLDELLHHVLFFVGLFLPRFLQQIRPDGILDDTTDKIVSKQQYDRQNGNLDPNRPPIASHSCPHFLSPFFDEPRRKKFRVPIYFAALSCAIRSLSASTPTRTAAEVSSLIF